MCFGLRASSFKIAKTTGDGTPRFFDGVRTDCLTRCTIAKLTLPSAMVEGVLPLDHHCIILSSLSGNAKNQKTSIKPNNLHSNTQQITTAKTKTSKQNNKQTVSKISYTQIHYRFSFFNIHARYKNGCSIATFITQTHAFTKIVFVPIWKARSNPFYHAKPHADKT